MLRERALRSRRRTWAMLGTIIALISVGLVAFVYVPLVQKAELNDAMRVSVGRIGELMVQLDALSAPAATPFAATAAGPADAAAPDLAMLERTFQEITRTLSETQNGQRQLAGETQKAHFDAAVSAATAVNYPELAMRALGAVLLLYLVRILIQLYRDERLLEAHYSAQADALELLATQSSSSLAEVVSVLAPTFLSASQAPPAPYEWAGQLLRKSR